MDVDKTTVRFAFAFSLIVLLLSLLIQVFSLSQSATESSNTWLDFAFNLLLGFFSNGVLIVLVSLISAKRKFKNLVNKMLFYSKIAKINYDSLPYADKSRFFLISQKIVDCYENFYQNYTEIEFMFFNRKYEESIHSLFNSFTAFVSPFNSAIITSETHDIPPKQIDFYQAEAQTMTKLKFHDFIHDYVDLYDLWDRKMLDFVIDNDEWSKTKYGDEERKHETIREIVVKK